MKRLSVALGSDSVLRRQPLPIGPDIAVCLQFNSPIDQARSRLSVVLPDQSLQPLAIEPPRSPATMNSRIRGLVRGAYKLR